VKRWMVKMTMEVIRLKLIRSFITATDRGLMDRQLKRAEWCLWIIFFWMESTIPEVSGSGSL